MKNCLRVLSCVLFLTAASPAPVHADFFLAGASDVATVRPDGPRGGLFGKIFLNVEGRNNGVKGKFASYGVTDFDSTQLGVDGTLASVQSVSVFLTQANAAFTRNGRVRFLITADTATSIQPEDQQVYFDLNDACGLNGQLEPATVLGTGDFIQGKSGDGDFYQFPLKAGSKLETFVRTQINSGGALRILICPDGDEDVAATWAGVGNDRYLPPLLLIEATRE